MSAVYAPSGTAMVELAARIIHERATHNETILTAGPQSIAAKRSLDRLRHLKIHASRLINNRHE